MLVECLVIKVTDDTLSMSQNLAICDYHYYFHYQYYCSRHCRRRCCRRQFTTVIM